MNNESNFDNTIKLLLIGDSSVGKTNFIFRFVDNRFQTVHLTTIGFDFKSKIVTLPNSKKTLKLQIWDTAGQERYMSLNQNLFLKVHGVILMYDISNRDSFDHLTKWLDLIKDAINDIPIVLVGNKIDKEEERLVSYNEGEQLAKELNISFFESSGKENKNVKEPFYSLCEEIINKMKNERTSTNNFSINNQKEKEKKKKCCKNF
jgi:Ras-related protein Rab-1A